MFFRLAILYRNYITVLPLFPYTHFLYSGGFPRFFLFPPPSRLWVSALRRGNLPVFSVFHLLLRHGLLHRGRGFSQIPSFSPVCFDAGGRNTEKGSRNCPVSGSHVLLHISMLICGIRRRLLSDPLYLPITSSVSLLKRCIFFVSIASSIRSSTLTSISAGTLEMMRLPLYSI